MLVADSKWASECRMGVWVSDSRQVLVTEAEAGCGTAVDVDCCGIFMCIVTLVFSPLCLLKK